MTVGESINFLLKEAIKILIDVHFISRTLLIYYSQFFVIFSFFIFKSVFKILIDEIVITMI